MSARLSPALAPTSPDTLATSQTVGGGWLRGRGAVLNAPGQLAFEIGDVLQRVDELGDLFAPVLKVQQRLPTGS